MNSRLFAAYGAGLNRTDIAKHCPTAKLIGSAVLKNYRLSFRGSKASAVATIEKAKSGSVAALLWEISPQDEIALERWIGVPELYRKATIKVRRDGALVETLIYILICGKPLSTVAPMKCSVTLFRKWSSDKGVEHGFRIH